jgi:hypothetical protein
MTGLTPFLTIDPLCGVTAGSRRDLVTLGELLGDAPEALSPFREARIGPKAEATRAAPYASATARRAPIVKAAS